eukprot:TRINITY_DN9735_c0_g1_i1.p1 TRINITY_DN9735_c0_g1~~TRINITY_DN9735_c0_g1_i1.p1  ORF type:complete len:419 (-),score=133.24 TRINITY_DN9735_c0_g1_i1:54-1310(-)
MPKRVGGPLNEPKQKRPRMNYKPILSFVNEGNNSVEGSVYTWGSNDAGQLGVSGQKKKPTAVKNLQDLNLLQFEAGKEHNLVIETSKHTRGRHLYSFGNNESGVLGRGDSGEIIRDADVIDDFDGKKIVQVSTGESHVLALSSQGHVYSWGIYKNNGENVGFKSDRDENEAAETPEYFEELGEVFVVQVASTANMSIALSDRGDLYEWGNKPYGSGRASRSTSHPLSPQRCVVNAGKVIAVYGGGNHCIALGIHGEVYAWGLNNYGQLGHGGTRTKARPSKIKGFADMLPEVEEDSHPVNDVSCGFNHSVVLDREGNVFTFGNNEYGQLGLGHNDEVVGPQKVDFFDGKNVISVASGYNHNLALTEGGDIYAWGQGAGFKLGNNSENDEYKPVKVTGLPKGDVVMIAAGEHHSGLVVA